MSHPNRKWSERFPGYQGSSEAEENSGWPQRTLQNAFNRKACKNAKRVCELDPINYPKCIDMLFSNQDVRNMRFLKKTLKHKPNVEELRNIDTVRAQYKAGQPISVPKKRQSTSASKPSRSTAAPKAAQPKEATAAVVEVSTRRSRIKEGLINVAAAFIIVGGSALGLIAFMVVCIGVAALM